MNRLFVSYAIIVLLLILSSCNQSSLPQKDIIGETAVIDIVDSNYSCLARIDTGAASTSIHAFNVRIDGGVKEEKENIGKIVTFDTINDLEIKKTFSAKIIDVDTIKNSQGTELRYRIMMKIGWKGKYKEIPMNIRNRSGMAYMLLIGRSFLKDDYLVDVTKSEDTRK